MPTAQSLIDDTRRHLLTGHNEELNRLEGAIGPSDLALAVEFDAGGIAPGSTISVGLEEMHVWALSGQTLEVQRGMNGSTPAAHADGAVVTVRPKFSDFRIFRALNDDLLDLSSPTNGLFRVETVEATYNAARNAYDLTGATNVFGVLDVWYENLGSSGNWSRLNQWRWLSDVPTSDFASGNAVFLDEGADPGRSLLIRFKTTYGQLVTAADDVETTTGLQDSAMDLPPLGAAIRLMIGRDVRRSFNEIQGEPRRAEEVPVGSAMQASRPLIAWRQTRIQAEAGRLASKYRVHTK